MGTEDTKASSTVKNPDSFIEKIIEFHYEALKDRTHQSPEKLREQLEHLALFFTKKEESPIAESTALREELITQFGGGGKGYLELMCEMMKKSFGFLYRYKSGEFVKEDTSTPTTPRRLNIFDILRIAERYHAPEINFRSKAETLNAAEDEQTYTADLRLHAKFEQDALNTIFNKRFKDTNVCTKNREPHSLAGYLDAADPFTHRLRVTAELSKEKRELGRKKIEISSSLLEATIIECEKEGKKGGDIEEGEFLLVEGVYGSIGETVKEKMFDYLYTCLIELAYKTKKGLLFNLSFNLGSQLEPVEWVNYVANRLLNREFYEYDERTGKPKRKKEGWEQYKQLIEAITLQDKSKRTKRLRRELTEGLEKIFMNPDTVLNEFCEEERYADTWWPYFSQKKKKKAEWNTREGETFVLEMSADQVAKEYKRITAQRPIWKRALAISNVARVAAAGIAALACFLASSLYIYEISEKIEGRISETIVTAEELSSALRSECDCELAGIDNLIAYSIPGQSLRFIDISSIESISTTIPPFPFSLINQPHLNITAKFSPFETVLIEGIELKTESGARNLVDMIATYRQIKEEETMRNITQSRLHDEENREQKEKQEPINNLPTTEELLKSISIRIEQYYNNGKNKSLCETDYKFINDELIDLHKRTKDNRVFAALLELLNETECQESRFALSKDPDKHREGYCCSFGLYTEVLSHLSTIAANFSISLLEGDYETSELLVRTVELTKQYKGIIVKVKDVRALPIMREDDETDYETAITYYIAKESALTGDKEQVKLLIELFENQYVFNIINLFSELDKIEGIDFSLVKKKEYATQFALENIYIVSRITRNSAIAIGMAKAMMDYWIRYRLLGEKIEELETMDNIGILREMVEHDPTGEFAYAYINLVNKLSNSIGYNAVQQIALFKKIQKVQKEQNHVDINLLLELLYDYGDIDGLELIVDEVVNAVPHRDNSEVDDEYRKKSTNLFMYLLMERCAVETVRLYQDENDQRIVLQELIKYAKRDNGVLSLYPERAISTEFRNGKFRQYSLGLLCDKYKLEKEEQAKTCRQEQFPLISNMLTLSIILNQQQRYVNQIYPNQTSQ